MEEFFLQPVSESIFKRKYMLHNEESVEQVFSEIAEELSSKERESEMWKNKFFQEMIEGKFIPAGRILANARPYSKLKNYLNCFVIDIQDSMDGIFNALTEDAMISKVGGGVGFNISKLRPKEATLSSGGTASGPLSFLKIFDKSASVIHTGGSRRSAHIAILDVSHPDIEEFITIKQGDNNKELTQFNISVGITDDFIQAVKNDEDWDLTFNGKVYKTLPARELYDKITKNSYTYNEPGIFNLDVVNKYSNSWYIEKIKSPNPCGEQPLPPYSACDLGAINLTKFVKNPFENNAFFDYESFAKTIPTAVRFLDNVIDLTEYPLKKIEEKVTSERRIGLGITGLGGALAMLKLKYGTDASLKEIEKIAETLRNVSYEASAELAAEKGSFAFYDEEMFLKSEFVKNLPKKNKKLIKKHGMRNTTCNTIAPTGTTSLSVGQNCSSGIEPIFSLEYNRNIRTDSMDNFTQERVFDSAWLLYKELMNKSQELEVPNFFKTALEIEPKKAIEVQALLQKYIDSSISKTLNIPESYSENDYRELYMFAYEKGLKGFTSFRIGSMQGILETMNSSKQEKRPIQIERTFAPKRPKELLCDIHEISVNKERHIVLVGKLNGILYEIFVTNDPDNTIEKIGQKEGVIRKVRQNQYQLIIENGEDKIVFDNIAEQFDSVYASLSRFISMSLRHGVPLQFIVDQLQKDKNFIGFERTVARILKRYIKEGEKVLADRCQECGDELVYKDGCVQCISCGFSYCE